MVWASCSLSCFFRRDLDPTLTGSPSGDANQFDWSHEVVLLRDVTTTVKVAVRFALAVQRGRLPSQIPPLPRKVQVQGFCRRLSQLLRRLIALGRPCPITLGAQAHAVKLLGGSLAALASLVLIFGAARGFRLLWLTTAIRLVGHASAIRS